MSPKEKPQGPWGETAQIELGDAGNHWVTFLNVPCGLESTDVTVLVGLDSTDRLALFGLQTSLPMTTPRLKALPIAALRRAAVQTLMLFGQHPGGDGWVWPAGHESDLKHLRNEDRHSDLFLQSVAAHCRASHASGEPATESLAQALQISISTAERYIRAAREAGFETGTTSPHKSAKRTTTRGNK